MRSSDQAGFGTQAQSPPGKSGTFLRRLRRPSAVLLAAALAGGSIVLAQATGAGADPLPVTLGQPSFGPNVVVFTPQMPQATIQAELDAISTQQVPNQFGPQRYAIFFEPGTYGSVAHPLVFQVGFYTEVAGLGAMPQDTVINGAVDVFNQCSGGSCSGLDNFWRSMSNLTVNVHMPSTPPAYAPYSGDPYTPYCDNTGEMWAVSQAAPIRRTIINGSLILADYCAPTFYTSGGFMADSQVTGSVDFISQQQFLVRNANIGGSSNSVWNQVFSGVNGAPPTVFTGTGKQYTTLATSPVTSEQPFLYTDSSGNYNVFIPGVQHNSIGPAWASGTETGSSLPVGDFFLANPSTPVQEINLALALGTNLILEPGVYNLDSPIRVVHPDTVVLGLGFATLVPQQGNAAMIVDSNEGVRVTGLIVDGGPVNSPVLLSVGNPGHNARSATDPDVIQSVYFRLGGAELGKATVSLLDNASNSIIDDVWAWRADHGNPGTVGWTLNTGDTGVAVTGDNVTAYGLAVEHYQKYEVVWAGQGGTDVFFQNENPYDPPSQAAWMATPTQDGYPAFFVAPNVKTFQGYGMGSYSVFIDTPATIYSAEAFQAPVTPGVQFHDIFDLYISGTGGFQSVINGTGGPANSSNATSPVDVVSYP
ncbi:MAG: coagulation factor 5/8 type domain protein [Acidimicrobiaceae bacterium]|nr:coagulation factor 5/8 type domain protein [Acidimicrobiaceae bacterium]